MLARGESLPCPDTSSCVLKFTSLFGSIAALNDPIPQLSGSENGALVCCHSDAAPLNTRLASGPDNADKAT